MELDLDDDYERVWLYRIKPYLVRVEEGMPKQLLDADILSARFRENPEQEWLLTLGPVETVSARAGVLPFLILPGDPVLFELRGTGVVAVGLALGASQIPPPNLKWMIRFEVDVKASRDLKSRPVSEALVAPLVPDDTRNNLVDVAGHWDLLREAIRKSVAPPRRAAARRTKA